MGTIAGILGALGLIGTGVATWWNNRKEDERLDKQNQVQQDLINQQNSYNSPASQMERYRSAGLNSNLIYSNGNSGNQSSIANYQQPRGGRGIQSILSSIDNIVGTLSNVYQLNSMEENLKQQRLDTLNKKLNLSTGITSAFEQQINSPLNFGLNKSQYDLILPSSEGLFGNSNAERFGEHYTYNNNNLSHYNSALYEAKLNDLYSKKLHYNLDTTKYKREQVAYNQDLLDYSIDEDFKKLSTSTDLATKWLNPILQVLPYFFGKKRSRY